MAIAAQTFEELALANPNRLLEMHRGQVREKPPMTWDHTDMASELGFLVRSQIDPRKFRVHINGARLRHGGGTYYVPDLAIIPVELGTPFKGRANVLAVLDDPVLLVVEIWSPSTGGYDINEKIPEYQARGDAEIWRLHPFEHVLTAWRRQPDGTYDRIERHGGKIELAALPGVVIDLDALFP